MIGMIGLIGCIYAIVLGAVSAAVSIVSLGYGISSALENEERVEEMDAKNLENQKRSEIIQRAQQRKSLIRAAQMAASGSLLDRIKAVKATREAKKVREQASRGQHRASLIPITPRDYGSPIASGNYK